MAASRNALGMSGVIHFGERAQMQENEVPINFRIKELDKEVSWEFILLAVDLFTEGTRANSIFFLQNHKLQEELKKSNQYRINAERDKLLAEEKQQVSENKLKVITLLLAQLRIYFRLVFCGIQVNLGLLRLALGRKSASRHNSISCVATWVTK